MRLEDEFAAIQAATDKQKHKENAALIAREYNLPDEDVDLLASFDHDERMMRVLAKRLEQDRPQTLDEQIRSL